MTASTFRLGPMTFSVRAQCDDPVFDAVCEEVSVLDRAPKAGADVVFRFVDAIDEPEQTLQVGRWRLGDGVIMGEGWGYSFCMTRQDGGFDVQVCTDTSGRSARDHFDRAWDWNFLASWETTAKNFMYDLFDLVTGAVLLERHASYLHASTCVRGDDAVALIAWGGIGKTTSVLKLVTEDEWQFLSDDLGLVGEDKTVWRTPRKLQVYAYNVAGQEPLRRRLMSGRGPIDHINWHWRLARFGPKKVRRRVGAEKLFGQPSVGMSGTLSQAYFLERADVEKMQWNTIGTEELAHRAATILIDELDTLYSVAVAAESHGVDVGIPGLEELRAASVEILEQAFDGVAVQLLRIPVDAGPDALVDALRQRLPD